MVVNNRVKKQVLFHGGGLPAPLATITEGFIRQDMDDGIVAFVLPDARDKTELLDPKRWDRQIKTSPRRSQLVILKDEQVRLNVRSMRSPDDDTMVSFAEEFALPSAAENVKKAQFIYEHLRYEDTEIKIEAERPLGYVQYPGGKEEEVYLAITEEKRNYGQLDQDEKKRADKAWEKYNKVKRDLKGFEFVDTDLVEKADNVLFSFDTIGRVVVTKKDTEYTRIVDLKKLEKEAIELDESLASIGFMSGPYDTDTPYGSKTGHNVSERLLGACRLMTDDQAKEFLGPRISGELVKRIRGYNEENQGPESDEKALKTGFMNTLSTLLSDMSELVPEHRIEFTKATIQNLSDAKGDERALFSSQFRSKSGFESLKPIQDDKAGIIRP